MPSANSHEQSDPRGAERRHPGGGRRSTDDTLTPDLLLGYERWAGQMWRHRGKLAATIGICGSLAGCVVGYLGRAHDLDGIRVRITTDSTRVANRMATDSARVASLEEYRAAQERTEALKMSMLCSLVRRVDPPGVPSECNAVMKR